jgi:transglutaminase-like putative cysteine protease
MERIDDIDIRVDDSKKHGIVPTNDYYSSEGIFYSDARVCYFSLPLVKQGSTSKVSYTRTVLDPHYLTSILFMEPQSITDQEIKIIIPSWMKAEIKEFNFAKYSITKNVTTKGDETEYTYTMKNLPAAIHESSAPGLTYYAPHLLILNKYAETSEGKLTYFNTLKDQYNWYHKLVMETGNDEKVIRERTTEVVKGLSTDQEKVKAVFQWVQDNIRYIAFEDGIAGFRPEKAQEVMRKKYGDCKGMANLTTEMLRSIGIDARKCWIGTRHIAYDYTTPSLAVDNHMISVWMNGGKPVYLDATEKYIGFGEVAERIQGRQTLIEDGNNYIVGKVPVTDYLQNTAYEKRQLSVDGSSLKGHIVQGWKGENKVWLLTALNSIKQDKQENALRQFLSEGKNNFEISDMKVANLNDYNKDLNIEYNINWKNVLSEFGDDTYVEIDNRRNMENFKIDTSARKLPYWFYFKNHLVFETELRIPEGKKPVELPAVLAIKRPGYSFSGSYTANGSNLSYKCEIILHQSELKPEQFPQWNKDIEQLKNFYNQQIVLKKTK